MKILVVTGKLAEATVKEASKDLADVLKMDVEIAAFVTPGLLRQKKKKLESYDLVLVSGLVSADFRRLEEEIGVPIRLGPKDAIDLSFVLPFAEEIEFSFKTPACEILSLKRNQDALKRINELEKDAEPSFLLRDLKIGGNSSMKVMGEIVDCMLMSEEELDRKIKDYTSKGADVIDLGIGLDCDESDVKRAVEKAVSVSEVPISIDTSDTGSMLIGIECGVDLVLSLDLKSLEEVGEEIADHDLPIVVVPDDSNGLLENVKLARSKGIEKIIADPILSPIGHGAIKSLVEYHEFRQHDRRTPLFFGVGNVTELIDVDSIGVNAVLAGLAMELDASILFTPEYSDKAIGSIRELKTASQMMFLAKDRKSAPKDIGIDMLVVKEKRRRRGAKVESTDGLKVVHAQSKKGWKRDPCGSFKIYIDDGNICARNEEMVIVGRDAKEIFDTIVKYGSISLMEHAGYLGRELMRAEIALRFGRSHVQDDEHYHSSL
ncbi:MAG: dihydropteroate synthase-like protein [Halobacteriota archaeon]|nr:dihydropteroate synthase-like protein [Halobacteriota archaeon]